MCFVFLSLFEIVVVVVVQPEHSDLLADAFRLAIRPRET